ncbi:hypothetical protein NDU88_001301 [Pleurodeles waltl]|uniref:Uncharacterized protein n=1 Tax=Pleurodeles waltl TaxID=8319 RepID=A0AAV7WNX1_PLEWA|nr:hypothetical protein NDU88_001301 [Pleurodeles waltl]
MFSSVRGDPRSSGPSLNQGRQSSLADTASAAAGAPAPCQASLQSGPQFAPGSRAARPAPLGLSSPPRTPDKVGGRGPAHPQLGFLTIAGREGFGPAPSTTGKGVTSSSGSGPGGSSITMCSRGTGHTPILPTARLVVTAWRLVPGPGICQTQAMPPGVLAPGPADAQHPHTGLRFFPGLDCPGDGIGKRMGFRPLRSSRVRRASSSATWPRPSPPSKVMSKT